MQQINFRSTTFTGSVVWNLYKKTNQAWGNSEISIEWPEREHSCQAQARNKIMVAGKVLKNTPAAPPLQFARWRTACASVPWISFLLPGMHHKLWHCSAGVCSQTWQVLHEVRQAWQEIQGTVIFQPRGENGFVACDKGHVFSG